MTPRERAHELANKMARHIIGESLAADDETCRKCTEMAEQAITEAVAEEAARADLLTEALKDIAAFNDKSACAYLANTGSYGCFDEPGSVLVARKALSALSAPPAPEGE